MCKSHFFKKKLLVLSKRSSDIDSSVEQPLNSNVKAEGIINHVCYFDLPLPS